MKKLAKTKLISVEKHSMSGVVLKNIVEVILKNKKKGLQKRLSQIQSSVDYNKSFASIVCLDTMRIILAIAARNKWAVEEVNMEQPPGTYEIIGHENQVYKLKKTLYRLKHAPRAWYGIIDSYLLQNGFNRCNSDPIFYTKLNEQCEILIDCLHVDDLILMCDLSIKLFK